jgi:sugar/nucleoside kinase (ribokinase family)
MSTIVIGADGERFIAFDDSALASANPVFDAAAAVEADVLLVDGYAPLAVSAVLDRARHAGVPVVADIEFAGPQSQELLTVADHLVIPLDLAVKVSGIQAPHGAIERLWSEYRRAIVVTDGARGAWFASADDRAARHQPAYQVEVTDTSGCGDVFHGAYCLALARGAALPEAVRYAAAAAAICATGSGGRGRLPTEAALTAFTGIAGC